MTSTNNSDGISSASVGEDWKDDDFVCLNDSVISTTRAEVDGRSTYKFEDVEDKVNTTNAQTKDLLQRKLQEESSPSQLSILGMTADHWPPWKNLSGRRNRQKGYYQQPPGLIKLHNEIVDFVSLMEPWPEEVEEREGIIREVTDIIHKTFGGSDNVSRKNNIIITWI
jgi:hypothetical protein